MKNSLQSNGWFHQFNQSCNWHSTVVMKQSASAIKEMAYSFPNQQETVILEEGYSSKTIFNVDETGLF